MSKTIPILTERLACFGICCDVHARCQHYADVEQPQEGFVMGTCMTADGYPLFVERKAEQGGEVGL